jgi:hypothetical protein
MIYEWFNKPVAVIFHRVGDSKVFTTTLVKGRIQREVLDTRLSTLGDNKLGDQRYPVYRDYTDCINYAYDHGYLSLTEWLKCQHSPGGDVPSIDYVDYIKAFKIEKERR